MVRGRDDGSGDLLTAVLIRGQGDRWSTVSNTSRTIGTEPLDRRSEPALQGSIAARLRVLVVAAAGIQIAVALTHPVPSIVPDEIIYSELAKSIAAGHLPAVRSVTALDYGNVYPLLIAPAWTLFSDATQAYAAARVIGACVMALSAIPAYLLARVFLPVRSALIVASLAVFLPSLLLSGMLLTEVALYPVSLLVFLAIAHALRRPTARHQALALGAIALAVATKSVMVVMIPAYVVGVLLMALLLRRAHADAPQLPSTLPPDLDPVCRLLGRVPARCRHGRRRAPPPRLQRARRRQPRVRRDPVVVPVAPRGTGSLPSLAAPFLAAALTCVVAFRPTASMEERLFACLVLPTIFSCWRDRRVLVGSPSAPARLRLAGSWCEDARAKHVRGRAAAAHRFRTLAGEAVSASRAGGHGSAGSQ